MLIDVPITALQKGRPWTFTRARVSLFPIADCLYLFSLVEMKTNGIPRCPRQKECCAAHCYCLQTWELIQKRGQKRNALATPLPFRSSGAHYFESFQKRRHSANQNAALKLACFQPNDIARESKSLLRSQHFQAACYFSPSGVAIFGTLTLGCCLWNWTGMKDLSKSYN